MNPEAVPFISILFIALTLTVFLLIMMALNSVLINISPDISYRKRIVGISSAAVITWLFILELLAFNGFFLNFGAVPPRIIFIVVPPFAFVIWLAFSKKFERILFSTRPAWLVSIQSFRMIVEIILWLLFARNLIPEQMTFEGYNFDVLVGISAPFAAYLFAGKNLSKNVLIIWNFIGLALLINIVIISILSAPLPIRQFMNEPANTIIAYFPFVWLPGFLVPAALLFHLLSLKQLFRAKIIL